MDAKKAQAAMVEFAKHLRTLATVAPVLGAAAGHVEDVAKGRVNLRDALARNVGLTLHVGGVKVRIGGGEE